MPHHEQATHLEQLHDIIMTPQPLPNRMQLTTEFWAKLIILSKIPDFTASIHSLIDNYNLSLPAGITRDMVIYYFSNPHLRYSQSRQA